MKNKSEIKLKNFYSSYTNSLKNSLDTVDLKKGKKYLFVEMEVLQQ